MAEGLVLITLTLLLLVEGNERNFNNHRLQKRSPVSNDWQTLQRCSDQSQCHWKRTDRCINNTYPYQACSQKEIWKEQYKNCKVCEVGEVNCQECKSAWVKESDWSPCDDVGCETKTQQKSYRCANEIKFPRCIKIETKFCDLSKVCDGSWQTVSQGTCEKSCNTGIAIQTMRCVRNGLQSSNCDKSQKSYHKRQYVVCNTQQCHKAKNDVSGPNNKSSYNIEWQKWSKCVCKDGRGEKQRFCLKNCPSNNSIIEVMPCSINCNDKQNVTTQLLSTRKQETTSSIAPTQSLFTVSQKDLNITLGERPQGKKLNGQNLPQIFIINSTTTAPDESDYKIYPPEEVNWWNDKALISAVGGTIIVLLIILIICVIYFTFCKHRRSQKKRQTKSIKIPDPIPSTFMDNAYNQINAHHMPQHVESEYEEMIPRNRLSCPSLTPSHVEGSTLNKPRKPPRRHRPSQPDIHYTLPLLPVPKQQQHLKPNLVHSAPSSPQRQAVMSQQQRRASLNMITRNGYLQPIN